jgi:hypothetical protein
VPTEPRPRRRSRPASLPASGTRRTTAARAASTPVVLPERRRSRTGSRDPSGGSSPPCQGSPAPGSPCRRPRSRPARGARSCPSRRTGRGRGTGSRAGKGGQTGPIPVAPWSQEITGQPPRGAAPRGTRRKPVTAMGSPCSPTERYMIRIARELTLCRRVDTVIGSDAKDVPVTTSPASSGSDSGRSPVAARTRRLRRRFLPRSLSPRGRPAQSAGRAGREPARPSAAASLFDTCRVRGVVEVDGAGGPRQGSSAAPHW